MDTDWESDDDGREMQLKEWKRVESGLEKIGYKEGMESTQEDTLQDGFNQAFKQAISMAFEAGKLQGGICASLGCHNMTMEQDSNKTSDALENINSNISSLLSEIPEILCAPKPERCQSCSCSSDPIGAADNTNDKVQNYWARLRKIQENAEKEDVHLNASYTPIS